MLVFLYSLPRVLVPVPNLDVISGLHWAVFKGFKCGLVLELSPTGASGALRVPTRCRTLLLFPVSLVGLREGGEMLRVAFLRLCHTVAAGTMTGGTREGNGGTWDVGVGLCMLVPERSIGV